MFRSPNTPCWVCRKTLTDESDHSVQTGHNRTDTTRQTQSERLDETDLIKESQGDRGIRQLNQTGPIRTKQADRRVRQANQIDPWPIWKLNEAEPTRTTRPDRASYQKTSTSAHSNQLFVVYGCVGCLQRCFLTCPVRFFSSDSDFVCVIVSNQAQTTESRRQNGYLRLTGITEQTT